MKRPVHQILCLLFGGVFTYSGVMKVGDPTAFLLNVRSFEMVPDPYAAWLAMFLPWLEIFAGLAVVLGPLRRGGLLLLNVCLLVFLAAIGTAWWRGIDIRCSCFGSSQGVVSNYVELLVHNVVLLILGVVSDHVELLVRDVVLLLLGVVTMVLGGRLPGTPRPPPCGGSHL